MMSGSFKILILLFQIVGNVRSFLPTSLFWGSHFEIFTMSASSQENPFIKYFEAFSRSFYDSVAFTNKIEDLSASTTKSKKSSIRKAREIFSVRYSTTFVHVYMENLLSKSGYNYTQLEKLMSDLQKVGEWPHHCIFIGNFDKYTRKQRETQLKFYRYRLSSTFARGLILHVDMLKLEVLLICMECTVTLQKVDIYDHASPSSLGKVLDISKSNNRGVHADIREHLIDESQNGCAIASANIRPKYDYRWRSVCALYVIQENLNLTYLDTHEGRKKSTQPGFIADMESPAFPSTRGKKDPSIDVVPYGMRTYPFQFVAFQPTPHMTADDLLDPFDWIVWTLFFTGMVVIVLVAVTFEKYSITELISLELSLLTAFLEQPLPYKGGKNSTRKIVVICWLIWVFMMVVVSTGYKGALFSLLTKFADTDWPRDLKELVGDSQYALWTNEKHYGTVNGRFKIQPYLNFFFSRQNLSGIPGKDFPEEYFLLNKSTVHFDKNETVDVASKFIGESRTDDVFQRYQIGDMWTEKFAWLGRLPIEFTAPVSYFLDDDLVKSREVDIPGFERKVAWTGSRNFFYERFHLALGQLEQAGFFDAFVKHREIWFSCNSIDDVKLKLNLYFDIFGDKRLSRSSGCLNQMLSGAGSRAGNGADILAFSVDQVKGIMHLGLMGLGICAGVLMLEILEGSRGRFEAWLTKCLQKTEKVEWISRLRISRLRKILGKRLRFVW